jgi:glucose/arabinose dehydrogenase
LYVIERAGRLRRFAGDPRVTAAAVALDITHLVDAAGDTGLVGFDFHPRFAETGHVYLSYAAPGGPVVTSRIARFTSTDGGLTFDATTATTILDIEQTHPGRIHLNADLRFGPGGHLYAGFGDGGPQGDPEGHAQRLDSLRGKILRIGVDGAEPYAIPSDNPFVGVAEREEIFALGLRNPWRFSFDRLTGDLWVGDVGAGDREEIDIVRPGANLGWPLLEGRQCVEPMTCDAGGPFVEPIAEYPHGAAGASVTGGFVYRGRALPALAGHYVFGDFMTGEIFAVNSDGALMVVARTGRRLVSFAEDSSEEILAVDFASGRIFRVGAAGRPTSAEMPGTASR